MAESLRYKEKVTIVTGGSKGIGRGCVEVFVQNGSKVVITSNEEADGKALESDMNQSGPGEATFIYCDVTNEDNIKNLINRTVEKYGRIDCVINNAGWHPPYVEIDDVSADDFRKLVDLNVVSCFLVAKYALPYLRKTQGNIIQTSSMVGHHGQANAVAYCSTKGAITAMTKAMAIDEAKHGVRVNAFSPSGIWTPLVESFINQSEDPEKAFKDGENSFHLRRWGTPEECGKICLCLAADATFCTGQDIHVSGGSELGYGIKNLKGK